MGLCKCLHRVPYATILWTAVAAFGAVLALCAFNGIDPTDKKFDIDEGIHQVTIGNWTFWVVLGFVALDLLILFISFFTTGPTREALCKGHGCFKKFGLLIMYTVFAIAFLVTLGLVACFFLSTRAKTMGEIVTASKEGSVLESIEKEIRDKTDLRLINGDGKTIAEIVMKLTTNQWISQQMWTPTIGLKDVVKFQDKETGEDMWLDENGEVLERTEETLDKVQKFFDTAVANTGKFAAYAPQYTQIAKNEIFNYFLKLDQENSLKWLICGIVCLLFAHICLSITLRGNSIKAKDEEKTAAKATYGHGQIDV